MIRGSCLCGAVRFEVRALGRAVNCHCSMCRKAHGAAFASYARVEASDFSLLAGKDEIAEYRSSPEVTRTFCRRCGSTLQFISTRRPGSFSLALGTLDDDPGVRPSLHIFVDSKAPWFDIADGLPQRGSYP